MRGGGAGRAEARNAAKSRSSPLSGSELDSDSVSDADTSCDSTGFESGGEAEA